jgi:outer membrane assembly lipoprotein YfiO
MIKRMHGLCRLSALLLPLSAILISCSGLDGERPPAAGTVSGPDPEASALFAAGRAAEESGKTGNALDAYEKIGKKHAYADVAAEAKFREAYLLDQKGELLKAFEAYDVFINRYRGSSRYSQALSRQAEVAHSAAEGHIKESFLGIKTKVGLQRATEMLATVRDNAPQSKEAPRAQFAIGQVWETDGKEEKAIPAYEKILDDYPNSSYAPEAQFRIGKILLTQADNGNQNQANLDKADDAFRDLISRYPNSQWAPEARKELATIASRDLQRSYDIGEFYYKKKQYPSAAFYYRDVIKRAPDSELKERARQRLNEINGMAS